MVALSTAASSCKVKTLEEADTLKADDNKGEGKKKKTTFAYLNKAHDNDETQGQKLSSSEDILDTGGPAHAAAVHPCQQH